MSLGLKLEDIPAGWRSTVSLAAFVAVILIAANFVMGAVQAEAAQAARKVVMEEWAVEVKKAAVDAARTAAREAVVEQVGLIAREQAVIQGQIREVDTRITTHIQVKDADTERRLNRLEDRIK